MNLNACDVGARATIYIALNSSSDDGPSLNQLSSELDVPSPLMAKILGHLIEAEILTISKSGRGYNLNPEHSSTLLLSVLIESIDRENAKRGCGYGLEPCTGSEPCVLHDQFAAMRMEIDELMASTSISTL